MVPNPRKVDLPEVSEEALDVGLKQGLGPLGSWSIGKATRGRLFGGVTPKPSPYSALVEPDCAWGTEETVLALEHAIAEVNRLYPDSHVLSVGHLSRKHGGWLRPHRSHQSGRDVDLGFYYTDGSRWYVNGTPQNFDVQRSYALVASLLKTAEVEYIFIDRSLKDLLRSRAIELKEPNDWIEQVFDGIDAQREPIVRHARGHRNHLHVRFASPRAVELARISVRRLGGIAYQNASLVSWLLRLEAKQRTDAVADSRGKRP
jgi:penicillin-insensitive murein endopeptidase